MWISLKSKDTVATLNPLLPFLANLFLLGVKGKPEGNYGHCAILTHTRNSEKERERERERERASEGGRGRQGREPSAPDPVGHRCPC